MPKTTRLGEMLLEAGLIDRFQLESGLSFQRNVGGRIGSALVKLGYIAEETILQFLDEQDRFERIELRGIDIPVDVLSVFPAARLIEKMVIPVKWESIGRTRSLVVAMTDPTNQILMGELEFIAGVGIRAVVAAEAEIEAALKHYFPDGRMSTQPVKVKDSPVAAPRAPIPLAQSVLSPTQRKIAPEVVNARMERLINLLMHKGLLTEQDLERLR
jgi:type IV pilus assembly protein PilB